MEKPRSFWVEDDEGWTAFSLVPPMPTTEALTLRIRVDDKAGAAEPEYKDSGATPSAEFTPRFGSRG
jgi:hypothetical protein